MSQKERERLFNRLNNCQDQLWRARREVAFWSREYTAVVDALKEYQQYQIELEPMEKI